MASSVNSEREYAFDTIRFSFAPAAGSPFKVMVPEISDIKYSFFPIGMDTASVVEKVNNARKPNNFKCLYNNMNVLMSYLDRKSTRLNSSHVRISYAVFCLKKKK